MIRAIRFDAYDRLNLGAVHAVQALDANVRAAVRPAIAPSLFDQALRFQVS